MKRMLHLLIAVTAVLSLSASAETYDVTHAATVGKGTQPAPGTTVPPTTITTLIPAGAPTTTNRYVGAHSWAEGTVSSKSADGRLSIRGRNNPYANDYVKYHHDYYSNPESRAELNTRYRDRFHHTWNDTDLNDYTFNVPDYTTANVYNEPNYGTDYTGWVYPSDSQVSHFNDLNVGDRVVIGYDDAGNVVRSLYRVPATRSSVGPTPGAPDYTSPNNVPNSTRAVGEIGGNHTRPTSDQIIPVPTVEVPKPETK